jgi:ABC-type transporter Mla maintaining outer membrane lipid asymmetry ATPase subunit MlaF
MLFQSGALLTDLSVFDNVAFPLREHTDLPQRLIRTLVLMRIEAVGLRAARDLMPAALSGGMARRDAPRHPPLHGRVCHGERAGRCRHGSPNDQRR